MELEMSIELLEIIKLIYQITNATIPDLNRMFDVDEKDLRTLIMDLNSPIKDLPSDCDWKEKLRELGYTGNMKFIYVDEFLKLNPESRELKKIQHTPHYKSLIRAIRRDTNASYKKLAKIFNRTVTPIVNVVKGRYSMKVEDLPEGYDWRTELDNMGIEFRSVIGEKSLIESEN